MLIPCATMAGSTISPDRQDQIRTMLLHDCGACHGIQLTGGLGPALTPSGLQGRTDQELINTILNGRPDTAMPPWKNFLNLTEAGWLIKQLRTGDITTE